MYWMKRCMMLTALLGSGLLAYTQVDSTQLALAQDSMVAEMTPVPAEPLQLLNAAQLQRAKWYYSIDEAMRERDQVYKLAIKNQKLTEFPREILLFPNLQVLDLSGNRFKSLPDEIGQLRKLETLNLFNNRLKYLPLSLKELEELKVMYVGRNRLVEVPAWIGGLSKLRKLDVSYNLLTDYEIEKVQELLPRCEITH